MAAMFPPKKPASAGKKFPFPPAKPGKKKVPVKPFGKPVK